MGKRVAVVDSEHGSASKYANDFDFDVLELDDHDPDTYVESIRMAEESGEYGVVVLDSLSHAWNGTGGALEQVDKASARARGNSYAAWREVTPKHNALVEAMLRSPLHVIATMRSKMAYELVEEGGKKVPKKLGLAPVQREGMEYEFDVVADMDTNHVLTISKTRCRVLDRGVYDHPGEELADILHEWLEDGSDDPRFRRADPETLEALESAVEKITAFDQVNGARTADWWARNRREVLLSQATAAEKLDRLRQQLAKLDLPAAA